jgi:hypothetical protein
MVVLHSQSRRPYVTLSYWTIKATYPYSPITLSILDRFWEQVFWFTWLIWVLLHDSGGFLVPIILRFSSVFASYSFHVYFRKYPFSYLFPVILHSFLLPHKNMKTNMAPLSSVRFHSVFIPIAGPIVLSTVDLMRP